MTSTNKNAPTAIQIAGAKSWKPENTGDTISGTVVGFQTYEHPDFGKSPVLILDTGNDDAEGGRVRQVFILGVLLSQFKEMGGAKGGDTFTVIYLGDEESRNRKDSKGNPVTYHLYASYKGDAPELVQEVDLSDF